MLRWARPAEKLWTELDSAAATPSRHAMNSRSPAQGSEMRIVINHASIVGRMDVSVRLRAVFDTTRSSLRSLRPRTAVTTNSSAASNQYAGCAVMSAVTASLKSRRKRPSSNQTSVSLSLCKDSSDSPSWAANPQDALIDEIGERFHFVDQALFFLIEVVERLGIVVVRFNNFVQVVLSLLQCRRPCGVLPEFVRVGFWREAVGKLGGHSLLVGPQVDLFGEVQETRSELLLWS